MPSPYRRGRWRAFVKHNWEQFYLGLFDSYEEAVRAEDEFRSTIPNHRSNRKRKARQ